MKFTTLTGAEQAEFMGLPTPPGCGYSPLPVKAVASVTASHPFAKSTKGWATGLRATSYR
jgi:hypothetical protein